MRDPYLYEDVDVLRNYENIKDEALLRKAEADITNCAMASIYNRKYEKFNTATLQDIHRTIFGQLYDWAGEFRSIHICKSEAVLGGMSVNYSYPAGIKKELNAAMKELAALKRNGNNDRDIAFRMVRIIAHIWQIRPFREGNTRTVIVFAVLFAKSLGFEVNHELFRLHSSYVRNSLVMASLGYYSEYEHFEKIFFDAIFPDNTLPQTAMPVEEAKYEKINNYDVRTYKEQPHKYSEN